MILVYDTRSLVFGKLHEVLFMGFLFDFFPILLFFIVYKFYGIFAATGVAIIASFIQIGLYWLKNRKIEITQIVTFVILLVLGTATLLSKNPLFIKWKPTAVFWILATVFFISNFFGKKTIIEHLMDKKVTLPKLIWKKLNYSWIIFFTLLGAVNIYIVYHFSTDIWVDFKLFGILGATLIFAIMQSFYLAKFTQD